MLIGLYTSRLLLQILGVDDFGIYNVIGGIVMMFSFLSSSLSVASQRFLNFEMGRNNPKGVNEVFCMSVNILFLLAVVMTLFSEIIGLYLLYNYLSIPFERINAAFWVLQFSTMSLFVTVVMVPYTAMIVAKEDMRSFAYVEILGAILKLCSVFFLRIISFDYLIAYSFLILFIQMFIGFLYVRICRNKFEEIRFKKFWNYSLFVKMFSFSGWTTLSAITLVVRNQGMAIFYNAFYGVAVNAAIGIANQVNNGLNTLVQNFTTSFNPQIVKNYASGDWDYCARLHISGPKFSFFLLSVASTPFFLYGDYILGLWLTNVPPYALLFVHLILIDTLLKSLSSTCNTVVRATGNIKSYELIYNITSFLFLLLAYLCFVLELNIKMPYVCMIVATAILNLYISYRSCKVINISWSHYVGNVFLRMICSFGFPLLLMLIIDNGCFSFIDFLLRSIVYAIVVALSEYLIGFDTSERNFVVKVFISVKNKFIR